MMRHTIPMLMILCLFVAVDRSSVLTMDDMHGH